jgi:hypothetical protein
VTISIRRIEEAKSILSSALIYGRLADGIHATCEYRDGKFGEIQVKYAGGYDLPLARADADVIGRFTKLRAVVDKLNMGREVYEFEFENVWWMPPAEPAPVPEPAPVDEATPSESVSDDEVML